MHIGISPFRGLTCVPACLLPPPPPFPPAPLAQTQRDRIRSQRCRREVHRQMQRESEDIRFDHTLARACFKCVRPALPAPAAWLACLVSAGPLACLLPACSKYCMLKFAA